MENNTPLFCLRHSLAHLLAMAVQELRPGSQLGFGPPTNEGFYYDFLLKSPLNEQDFPALEKIIRQKIKQKIAFVQKILPLKEALLQIDGMQEPYKKEYAQELIEKQQLESLSFYQTQNFIDMCAGPHVENTEQIPLDSFKLKSIAGAYWRGDEKNFMMTRIYAWAFLTKKELDDHLFQLQQAALRDHKKLGKSLSLFTIDENIGNGLALWLPNGTVIRDELEKFIKEIEFKADYKRVCTPHIAKTSLYYKTGHLPYYQESMFPQMQIESESYSLRPMNCPHHHAIFAAEPRSYRDLPLRLAEYGQVYRYEDSGALSGLLRVRGFCMNDAHIYLAKEQIKEELLSLLSLYQDVYEKLGIHDSTLRLSTWDPEDTKNKFIKAKEQWEWTEQALRDALKEKNLPYVEGKGEAAFYGPKIDYQFKTVTGREETVSTIQIDFAMPERLGLEFIGADNQPHQPIIIHRAPLSTHERMIAFLIEKTAGAFPTWLSPVQVALIPVSEKSTEYAQSIQKKLKDAFVRVELDNSQETMGKRLRNAIQKKIPHILICGEKEAAEQTVSLRSLSGKQKTLSFEDFFASLLDCIQNRKDISLCD